MNISELTTKQNSFEVTDPNTQVSAEEYNAIVAGLQSHEAQMTPSGDPMHYVYIDATSLSDWQDRATWDATTQTWSLNGVSGLSNDDMRKAYLQTYGRDTLLIIGVICQFKNTTFRVNFPPILSSSVYYNVVSSFEQFLNWNAVVERFYYYTTSDYPKKINGMWQMLKGCTNLKAFDMYLDCSQCPNSGSVSDAFGGCTALETVWLKYMKYSVSFADSPNISKESILYLIQNAQPTSAMVVTLHATAYARLSRDSDIVSALSAQPLVTLASA